MRQQYIDNVWFIGKTKWEVEQNIMGAREVLTKLGYAISDKTYVLDPTQKYEHLGCVIDFVSMTVTLTE